MSALSATLARFSISRHARHFTAPRLQMDGGNCRGFADPKTVVSRLLRLEFGALKSPDEMLARKMGRSPRAARGYLNGERIPRLPEVIALAKASTKFREWLMEQIDPEPIEQDTNARIDRIEAEMQALLRELRELRK
jgi:hypothetical protein